MEYITPSDAKLIDAVFTPQFVGFLISANLVKFLRKGKLILVCNESLLTLKSIKDNNLK